MSEQAVYHLLPDEAAVLDVLRRAKKEGHADMEISVKDNTVVRLNWNHKIDLAPVHDALRRLKE